MERSPRMKVFGRLIILTPMVVAVLVAGGVTAALAFFVLPSSDPISSPPSGTSIAAPAVAETVTPTQPNEDEIASQASATAWLIAAVEDVQDAQSESEVDGADEDESTPTPRVI